MEKKGNKQVNLLMLASVPVAHLQKQRPLATALIPKSQVRLLGAAMKFDPPNAWSISNRAGVPRVEAQ